MFKENKKRRKEREKLNRFWDHEVKELSLIQRELDQLYCRLEDVMEQRLVDSIIYEIKSQEAKYDYHYHNLRVLEEGTDLRDLR